MLQRFLFKQNTITIMAVKKETMKITSIVGGNSVSVEAPVRPLSLGVLKEVEEVRKGYTDFSFIAETVLGLSKETDDYDDLTLKNAIAIVKGSGMTLEQTKELLRGQMRDAAMKNIELEMSLLKTIIERKQLTTEQKDLLDSDVEHEFWQNADLMLIREQAEQFFRRYQ